MLYNITTIGRSIHLKEEEIACALKSRIACAVQELIVVLVVNVRMGILEDELPDQISLNFRQACLLKPAYALQEAVRTCPSAKCAGVGLKLGVGSGTVLGAGKTWGG